MMLKRRTLLRTAGATLALAAAMAVPAPTPANAAVFNVSKPSDTLDGVCDLDCSLREAVVAANASAEADVIVLPAGLYMLTRTGSNEEASASGDLDIQGGHLVILGVNAKDTVLDGGGHDRVLDVKNGATVEIQNVTVQNGRAAGPGGGIRNQGGLSLSHSAIQSNLTTNFGFGGGIFTDGTDATLILRDSTLSGNTANGGGGGLAAGGTTTFSNVTVSGNHSETDFGGGLYVFSEGEGVFNNVTITGNSAVERGGGVLVESSAFLSVDKPEFRNSIIAGNTATVGDPDCLGSAASGGFNLIGIGGGCIDFKPADNDQLGTAAVPLNARFGPLADNGGSTRTHALLAGSPAVDAGNPALPESVGDKPCEAFDQRGVPRTLSNGRCDAGAFELTSFCVTGGPNLCLNNGRFKVNVVWRTELGQSGPGQAVQLTNDTGFFWFFQSSNVELTIKALDACAPPFNRFWVFLSGLTNVEVTVTVTDTATGQVKTYTNPQGRRFRPVLDTDAFATCG